MTNKIATGWRENNIPLGNSGADALVNPVVFYCTIKMGVTCKRIHAFCSPPRIAHCLPTGNIVSIGSEKGL